MMRLRITFAKTGALSYIGHLDLHQVWERTIRRAGLPLAYTQGFHPGPKMQIASALPLGFHGQAELIDIWLGDGKEEKHPLKATELAQIKTLIQSSAPPGLVLDKIEQVEERAPALQTLVKAVDYEVVLLENVVDLEKKVEAVLAVRTLPRERRGKFYDLRPLILALAQQPGKLQMRLVAREGATGRPEEVLATLGIAPEVVRITRTRLLFKSDVQ